MGGYTAWAEENFAPNSALIRAEAKYFRTVSDTNRKCGTNVPSVDKHRGVDEKRTVFVFLGKCMDEYNLNRARIMNPEKKIKIPLSKISENFAPFGEPSASFAVTDCADWTDCVTLYCQR